MNTRPAFKTSEPTGSLADQAASSAEQDFRSAQRVANETLDSLAENVQEKRHDAEALLNRATGQASVLARHGVDAVRDGTHQLRDQAQRASASTVNYIKEKPVKAMLISAATGAALMTLVSLMRRPRDRT